MVRKEINNRTDGGVAIFINAKLKYWRNDGLCDGATIQSRTFCLLVCCLKA
jgi:hypothetical protein